MLALLKLIPTSVWVTLAAVIALALTVLWFRDHERAIQHAADVAADQRVEATQMIHNEEVEARAKVLTDNAVAAYKAEHAAPPAADAPSVVCTLPAARPRPRACA